MKLNRKWLHEEFVDLSHISDKEFVEVMTVAGQKVETYERLDAQIKNVVVGKVLDIVRHENSDHMGMPDRCRRRSACTDRYRRPECEAGRSGSCCQA